MGRNAKNTDPSKLTDDQARGMLGVHGGGKSDATKTAVENLQRYFTAKCAIGPRIARRACEELGDLYNRGKINLSHELTVEQMDALKEPVVTVNKFELARRNTPGRSERT